MKLKRDCHKLHKKTSFAMRKMPLYNKHLTLHTKLLHLFLQIHGYAWTEFLLPFCKYTFGNSLNVKNMDFPDDIHLIGVIPCAPPGRIRTEASGQPCFRLHCAGKASGWLKGFSVRRAFQRKDRALYSRRRRCLHPSRCCSARCTTRP